MAEYEGNTACALRAALGLLWRLNDKRDKNGEWKDTGCYDITSEEWEDGSTLELFNCVACPKGTKLPGLRTTPDGDRVGVHLPCWCCVHIACVDKLTSPTCPGCGKDTVDDRVRMSVRARLADIQSKVPRPGWINYEGERENNFYDAEKQLKGLLRALGPPPQQQLQQQQAAGEKRTAVGDTENDSREPSANSMFGKTTIASAKANVARATTAQAQAPVQTPQMQTGSSRPFTAKFASRPGVTCPVCKQGWATGTSVVYVGDKIIAHAACVQQHR